MNSKKYAIFSGFFLLSALSAQAETAKLKPGLWEVQVKMNGKEFNPSALMSDSLAKLPPEQRKKIEKMMAAQGHPTAQPGNAGGMKVCIDEEQAKDTDFMAKQAKPNCTHHIGEKSASRMTMTFECADGSKGNGEWSLHGDSAYDFKMKMTSKEGVQNEVTQSGKFLTSDCGSIKPRKFKQ